MANTWLLFSTSCWALVSTISFLSTGGFKGHFEQERKEKPKRTVIIRKPESDFINNIYVKSDVLYCKCTKSCNTAQSGVFICLHHKKQGPGL